MAPETETPVPQPAKSQDNATLIHTVVGSFSNEPHVLKSPAFYIAVLMASVGIFFVLRWHYIGTIEQKDASIQTMLQTRGQGESEYLKIIDEKNSTIELLKQSNDNLSKGPTIPPPTVITQFVGSPSIVTQIQLVGMVGSIEATRFVHCQVTNLINGQKIVLADAPIPQTVKIYVNLDFARLVMLNKNASLDGNIITLTNFSSPQVKLIQDRVNNGVVFVEYVKQLSYKSP